MVIKASTIALRYIVTFEGHRLRSSTVSLSPLSRSLSDVVRLAREGGRVRGIVPRPSSRVGAAKA